MLKFNLRLGKRIGIVLRLLGLYPLARRLYQRLQQRDRKGMGPAYPGTFRPTELAQLPPHARKIFADLKAEVQMQRRSH